VVSSVAAAVSKPVSPEEIEKLKDVLANAAVSALDAGLELAKLLHALLAVLWTRELVRFRGFPIEEFFISLRDHKNYTLYNIARIYWNNFAINAKPLCQLMGLSGEVCEEEIGIPVYGYVLRKGVRGLLNDIYEMKQIGLLDKLVEVLDAAIENAKHGEYTFYDQRGTRVTITIIVGGGKEGYEVIINFKSESVDREAVVEKLRFVRDFVAWLGKLSEQLKHLVKRLKEAGVFDALVNRILRWAEDVVDSAVPDREKLEELVREAVKGKVDELLSSQPANDLSHLKRLAKNAMTYRYGDYVVILPDGVAKPIYRPISGTEILSLVELPDTDSLANLAVKAVRPDRKARVSLEKQLLVLDDEANYDWGIVRLAIGESGIANAALIRSDEHGIEAKAGLWVSGLIALGLTERFRPDTAREVLQKTREALVEKLREKVRDFVITKLFYSALREQLRLSGE
jgi:hypothetical protein